MVNNRRILSMHICHISMELMLKNSMKRLHLIGGFAARMQWDGPSDPPPDHPSVLADVPALSPSLVGPANGGNRTHAGPKDHPAYRETNGFWMFLASQDKKNPAPASNQVASGILKPEIICSCHQLSTATCNNSVVFSHPTSQSVQQ